MDTDNDNNIPVTAGTDLVTINFSDINNPIYSLESTSLWGVVGSATPNGWNGPDTKFERDFSSNDEV